MGPGCGQRQIGRALQGYAEKADCRGREMPIHTDPWPSRSGKTAATKLFVQCLMCQNLDGNTLNPCGICKMCNYDTSRFKMRGIETVIVDAYYHYVPIDCTTSSIGKEIETELSNLHELFSPGMRVVYLDEVHRLAAMVSIMKTCS